MKHLLIILVIIFYSCNSTDKIKELHFILPDNFKGNTLIVYNIPNGTEAKEENSNTTYKFDKSGVLLLNEDRKEGFYKMRYFTEDGRNIKEIFDLETSDTKKDDLLVSKHQSGSLECKGSENIKYSTFFISTKEMSDEDFIKKDSLINNFVKCN